ncbi:hypothetical protein BJH93_00845 [Kocuria polaris]|nr:hypothetical protein [Kocuria polaris]
MGIQGWEWLIMIGLALGALVLIVVVLFVILRRDPQPDDVVLVTPHEPIGHTPDGQSLYPAPQVRPTNTFAILALIFSFFVAILGVIFGHLARAQIRRTGEAGDGLALAGLIIGYAAIAGWALLLITQLVIFGGVMGDGGMYGLILAAT